MYLVFQSSNDNMHSFESSDTQQCIQQIFIVTRLCRAEVMHQMRKYYNNKCQQRKVTSRSQTTFQNQGNFDWSFDPWKSETRVWASEEKKQLTQCQRLMMFLQAKKTGVDYFHDSTLRWIERVCCCTQEKTFTLIMSYHCFFNLRMDSF